MQNIRSKAGYPEPNLYINTGDIADPDYVKYLNGVLLYPARGNNDSEAFWKRFNHPNYYSFNYLNTHFVMLYSGISDAYDQFPPKSVNPNCANPISQTDWVYCDLEKVRTDASIDNVIVVVHMPPLTFGLYKSNPAENTNLIPILRMHPKLRVILSGHNHFYQ